MLPTPASLAFAAKWLSLAPAMMERQQATQPAIREMHAAGELVACPSLCKCHRARRNVSSALRPHLTAACRVMQRCLPAWLHPMHFFGHVLAKHTQVVSPGPAA
jgi:hypothetical protein